MEDTNLNNTENTAAETKPIETKPKTVTRKPRVAKVTKSDEPAVTELVETIEVTPFEDETAIEVSLKDIMSDKEFKRIKKKLKNLKTKENSKKDKAKKKVKKAKKKAKNKAKKKKEQAKKAAKKKASSKKKSSKKKKK